MNDRLVNFQTALLAKQCGFNNPCRYCWNEGEFTGIDYSYYEGIKNDRGDEFVSAPTQSQLQTWLRSKNVYTIVTFGYKFEWEVRDCRPKTLKQLVGVYPWNVDPIYSDGLCDSYEDALETGLQQSLTILANQNY